MIDCEADRCLIRGSVTHSTVCALLDEGERLIDGTRRVFDLSHIEAVDSSVLSLMLEWSRHAATTGSELTYARPGPAVVSLIDLYGLGELLPITAE